MKGLEGAARVNITQEVSPWEVAKYYANEYWKFGQAEFPETIGLGYLFLLENDPENKLDFSRITGLLSRFGYDRETQLGFCYFLGSGLIDHIQKMTMAAIAIADMKV